MSVTQEYFERNGYVVLQDVLPIQVCNQLVDHMFELQKQGKLIKDEQCPLSDSIYGDEIFTNLLHKFAEPIGEKVGRKLIPTYTYSRIYRTGEILKRHKDRPACEISATLTLGYKAKKVWPIFFDEEKETAVDLEIGELAVYQGCEILHWRPAFKGEWHVQVFLHYVDADGPYAHHANDDFRKMQENNQEKPKDKKSHVKKPIFTAIEKPVEKPVEEPKKVMHNDTPSDYTKFKVYANNVLIPTRDNIFPGYFCIDRDNRPEMKFTPEECDKIIAVSSDSYHITASVGGTKETSKIARGIRSADIYDIKYEKATEWIFKKLFYAVDYANRNHFDYEIMGITGSLQLIRYSADQEIKGHYDWHIDSGNGEPTTRKISVTCQLTDPRKYSGCELIINNHAQEVIATKEQGSMHLFPSYMLHTVKPIISGERYALVVWIHGSRRFR